MKIRNIVFFMMAVCLLAPLQVYSQNSKIRKAYEEFNAGHYRSASDMLRKAYNSTKNNAERADIMFKIGECYRLTNTPKSAEMWYAKAIAKGYQNPIVHLRLGEMKKMLQKYAEAKEEFKKYKEKAPGDRRGNEGITSCDIALQSIESGSGYEVDNMKFFNSRKNDFAPAFASDDYSVVYFTSSRDASTGKNINAVTGEKFSDIFVSKKDRKGIWSQPVPIEGDVNTEHDEGMCSFTPDFKTIYFTRCRSSNNKAWGCQIVSAQLVNGKWTKEKVIDIAGDSVVVAHPAISPDELTLYFVSDMPGGQGGKDIWKITRASTGDNWSKPENLGPSINTPNDEMFPYVHPDGTLYFSSNGHIGLGGLDIFKAIEEDGNWTVKNMGYPINSPADDFGITFEADFERGFFSSSRTTTGDDDIYAFTLPTLRFTLIGLVKDEKTEQPLQGAHVKILSSSGTTIEIPTNNDGSFKHTLEAGTDYVFIASKQGYLNGKERETTKGEEKGKNFNIVIPLTSIARPIELPNILYDFNSHELRPESLVSLDRLVELLLVDNPNITIELGSHTDSRGTDAYNNDLSQRRAQSVVNYLLEKGVPRDRLTAKGYGKSKPRVVDEQLAAQHFFLRNGITLTEEFINSLPSGEQEIAHEYNRRTEFRVLRTDY